MGHPALRPAVELGDLELKKVPVGKVECLCTEGERPEKGCVRGGKVRTSQLGCP